ncbi:MAG TPA: hypothetical protein VK662_02470, partial [Acidothermaceae bacterium]|nr:hypothetical protein [Acidothermaceae bacterium]
FSPGANTDVDTPAPLPVPNLRASATLTLAQAATLSRVAAAASIAPPTGTYSCPMEGPGHDVLVVLGYPDRADVDLWYSDTGCQEVDNGHASEFLLAGGDFGGAVDALVAAPSEGPATPSASS